MYALVVGHPFGAVAGIVTLIQADYHPYTPLSDQQRWSDAKSHDSLPMPATQLTSDFSPPFLCYN